MNLVRRLLSHSLLILVVAGLIYAYTQRDALYPYLRLSQIEKHPVHAEQTPADAAAAGQADDQEFTPNGEVGASAATPQAYEATVSGSGLTGTESTPVESTDVAAMAGSVGPVPESPKGGEGAATEPRPGAGTVMPPETALAQASAGTETESVSVKSGETAATPPGEMAESVPTVGVDGTGNDPVSADQAIRLARQAYWRRNLAGAENYYRKAIELDADAVDAYGELGNIYMQGGRYRDAAKVYYEAAHRLQASGQIARALPLLQLMYRLDPERASRLERTLRDNGKRPDDPGLSESAPVSPAD